MFLVSVAFIAACVRDHQPGREREASDQLYSMLNSLPAYDPGRLQEKKFIRPNRQVGPNRGRIVIWRGWRIFEVHHVGDEQAGNARAKTELVSGRRVYHHMTDGRQVGRECHIEIIPDAVDQKTLALPEKIVVMSNRRNTGFSNKFRQSQSQGNIERDGQRVFDQEELYIIIMNKCFNLFLEIVF